MQISTSSTFKTRSNIKSPHRRCVIQKEKSLVGYLCNSVNRSEIKRNVVYTWNNIKFIHLCLRFKPFGYFHGGRLVVTVGGAPCTSVTTLTLVERNYKRTTFHFQTRCATSGRYFRRSQNDHGIILR